MKSLLKLYITKNNSNCTDAWNDSGVIGGVWTGSGSDVAIGTWQYYVGVWTGAKNYVYINSTQEAEDERDTGTTSNHVNMKTTIGGLDFAYGNFHDGLIDEIRISDIASYMKLE